MLTSILQGALAERGALREQNPLFCASCNSPVALELGENVFHMLK